MYKPNFIYHLSGSLRRAKGKLSHFTGKFHRGGSAAGSPGDRIAVIDISQSIWLLTILVLRHLHCTCHTENLQMQLDLGPSFHGWALSDIYAA